MKEAKEKVWVTKEGKLVEDGHDDAAILVASKGLQVPDDYVKAYPNGSSFFKDINKAADEPIMPHPHLEDFKPGQSNSKPSGGPADKVGPVKVAGIVGDTEHPPSPATDWPLKKPTVVRHNKKKK